MTRSPVIQYSDRRIATRTTARFRKQLLLVAVLTCSFGLSGCVVVENQHFVVDTSGGPDQATIRLGGQLTDQIVRLWEQEDFDSLATLESLELITKGAPLGIAGQDGLDQLPWTAEEIWERAISVARQPDFDTALAGVYFDISNRSLALAIVPGATQPDVQWIDGQRDFIGQRVFDFNNPSAQPAVIIRPDGQKLIYADTGETFVPWGVQMYLRHEVNGQQQLYTPAEMLEHFTFLRSINFNCVRIHVEYHRVMQSPELPDPDFLSHLEMVLDVAEQAGIYLDITGLDCYRLVDVPDWYHELDEQAHWDMQARYWATVARVCAGRSCVLFYDLLNEPVVSGGAFNPDYPWIVDGSFAGEYYLQRIAVDPNGRDPKEIAKAWIDKMVGTIRQHDPDTPVSVGVIAWGLIYQNALPVFYDPVVAENLDIVCIHHYPEENADNATIASRVTKYEIGKPIIIEEFYPLRCGLKVFSEFIDDTLAAGTDGWVSWYAGSNFEELAAQGTFISAVQAATLEFLRDNADRIRDLAR